MVSGPGLPTLDRFHFLSALERLLASNLLDPSSVRRLSAQGSSCVYGNGMENVLEGVSLFLSHHPRFHTCSSEVSDRGQHADPAYGE